MFQLWDISSGQLLLSVIFDTGLSSVCLDAAESSIFAGGTDGKIFQVNLFEKVRIEEVQFCVFASVEPGIVIMRPQLCESVRMIKI